MDCVLRIEADDLKLRRTAEQLAARYGLRTESSIRATTSMLLAMRDDGLELRDASCKPGHGLRIDFTQLAKRGRRANLSRRQPLARAIGRETRTVLDATAGLGQDAALLAAMGYEVVGVERHVALAALLDEALARAQDDPATRTLLGERLRFVPGDARQVLLSSRMTADCIYLDPMFPPKRKRSALASKEIRLVRALVGDDEDAAELLALARNKAKRVVVKRPSHAPPLAEDVSGSIAGKLVRYDLYVR